MRVRAAVPSRSGSGLVTGPGDWLRRVKLNVFKFTVRSCGACQAGLGGGVLLAADGRGAGLPGGYQVPTSG